MGREVNRPRTTEHFPRMKDRAKGREIRRQYRQVRDLVDALPSIAETFQAIGAAVVDTFSRVAAGWSKLIDDVFGDLRETTREDFALAPPPVGLQAMIDDAEGRELVAAILRRKNAA